MVLETPRKRYVCLKFESSIINSALELAFDAPFSPICRTLGGSYAWMYTLERERLTGVMGTDSRLILCALSRADGAPPDKSALPRPCN